MPAVAMAIDDWAGDRRPGTWNGLQQLLCFCSASCLYASEL